MIKWLGKWLALLLAVILFGASIAYAANTYQVFVPGKVEVAVTLSPGLSTSISSVDFFGVTPGTKSVVKGLKVKNQGDVTLSKLIVTGTNLPSGIGLLSSQSPSTPVAPGGEWDVWLQLDVAATTPVAVYNFSINFSGE